MQVRMGPQLFGAFLAAGPPAPEMRDEALVGGGQEFDGYAWLAGVPRSLAPLMAGLAITEVNHLELVTLSDRTATTLSPGGSRMAPPFVGAYARTPARSILRAGVGFQLERMVRCNMVVTTQWLIGVERLV